VVRGVAFKLGSVILALLCLLFGGVVSREQWRTARGIQAEIEAACPARFTVLALPAGFEHIGPQGLTFDQARSLARRLDGVADVAMVSGLVHSPVVYAAGPRGEGSVLIQRAVPYMAVSANYFSLMGLNLAAGRFFTGAEEAAGSRVCVVGALVEHAVGELHAVPYSPSHERYQVVGKLQPFQGPYFPLPWIWQSMTEGKPDFPSSPAYAVFTPISARVGFASDGLSGGRDTWVVPLVVPKPGQSEAARAVTTAFFEEVWPGAVLDFGVSGDIIIILEQVASRAESFYGSAFLLMLGLCLVGTGGFMVLGIARRKRAMAVERSLGATRLLLVLRAALEGGGLALLGVALGALAALPLITGILRGESGPVALRSVLVDFGWMGAGILGAGLGAALGAALWATGTLPVESLRRATVLPGRRAVDFRVPLAVLAVALASALLVSLVVSGRSSVSALESYLRSAGERVVVVRQDVFKAEGRLAQSDLLGEVDADLLREKLPRDWDVICQTVVPVEVRLGDSPARMVTAYGLDAGWPEEAGFALEDGALLTLGGPGSGESAGAPPMCYVGARLAEELGGGREVVGMTLMLNSAVGVTVAGVLAPRPPGVADRLGDRDHALVMSRKALAEAVALVPPRARTEVWVYLAPDVNKDEAVNQIGGALGETERERRGLEVEALVEEVSRLTRITAELGFQQVLLAGLAMATTAWLVGLIMMARVSDRRREIGIRRAVGASPRSLGLLVVGETLAMCAAGAVIGSGFGLLLADWYCASRGWPVTGWAEALLEVVGGVVVLGLLASLAPVRQALGDEPMKALREGEA